MDDTISNMLSSIIDDNYITFLNIVLKHRKLKQNEITEIANSRVFTGKQAKHIGLVDEIGGEAEALQWLEKEKKIGQYFQREIFN